VFSKTNQARSQVMQIFGSEKQIPCLPAHKNSINTLENESASKTIVVFCVMVNKGRF
jgi:hypothetical protein